MKRILAFLLVLGIFAGVCACSQEQPAGDRAGQVQEASTSADGRNEDGSTLETPPDPEQDYAAFYAFLLQQQAEGKIPYEDKLVPEGRVVEPFSLAIDGKTFDNAAAEPLTVYTATFELYTKVEGHLNSWVGYRLSDVFALLDVKPGASIRLHASDGFSQVFDTKNIDDNTMIAITKDGDPKDGPYLAPCSFLISANYTKYLTEITLP